MMNCTRIKRINENEFLEISRKEISRKEVSRMSLVGKSIKVKTIN